MRMFIRAGVLVALLGCGGGGASDSSATPVSPPTPVDPTPKVTTIVFTAGDGQTARKGTATSTTPTAVVKDQFGAGMVGITVTFSVTGGGAVVSPTAVTSTGGSASPGVWTLGTTTGANTLKATASGGSNPSSTITATARNPYWTVMVYLPGDNALSAASMANISEMEDTTASVEVQYVVQAEASPTVFAQRGCTASTCLNRPNYNTFRYAIPLERGTKIGGPDGPATDIGDRNMTDPLQLREFITYAKTTYPAEHYMVILSSNGGGATGFITDETSAPGKFMTVGDLPSAFSGVGAIDILAFDASSMGSYETLSKAAGLASYVVFSEDNQPGAGYQYDKLVPATNKTAALTVREMAAVTATAYMEKYNGSPVATTSRYSLTSSVYDMSGFAAFETALNTLASNLQANSVAFNSGIVAAAAAAQSFENRNVKDLGNFLDSLRVQISNTTTRSAIDATKSAATVFRVANNTYRGNGEGSQGSRDVGRATGMTILMPSLTGIDKLPTAGLRSLASYQAIFSAKAWGQFLNTWLSGKSEITYTDLGSNRFEAYLVWDEVLMARLGDLDLFLLEPDGNVYGPAIGSISSNSLFTTDSYEHPPNFLEGVQFQRVVQSGTYKLYAYLWKDGPPVTPAYNVSYRNSQTGGFANLFSGTPPKLSATTKFADDPTPTFTEVDAKAYTDFRLVAVITIPAGTVAAQSRSPVSISPDVGADRGPRLSTRQLRMLQSIRTTRARSGGPVPLQRPANLRVVAP